MASVTLYSPALLPVLTALVAGCATAKAAVAPAATGPITAPADARFMQGMIAHHAQALAMTRLVNTRTASADVRILAERIAASQREEIGLMQRWLRVRGQAVPDTTHLIMGHHMPGDSLMPGMLSAEEMRALEAARGDAFDRTFLALMIRHHEGALTMVQRLLASPGGSQNPEAFRFASDVDADQRAEIARMRRMLSARGSPGGPGPANFGP